MISDEVNTKMNSKRDICYYVKQRKKEGQNIIDNIEWSPNELCTHLVNPSSLLEMKIAGFNMNSYFQNYTIPNKWNYQQYLCKNSRFAGYLQLAIGTTYRQNFLHLLQKTNSQATTELCQSIVHLLYRILCSVSNSNKR